MWCCFGRDDADEVRQKTLHDYGWFFNCYYCRQMTSHSMTFLLMLRHDYDQVTLPVCRACMHKQNNSIRSDFTRVMSDSRLDPHRIARILRRK